MGGSAVAVEYLVLSLYHKILGLGLPSAIQLIMVSPNSWPNVLTGGSVIIGGISMLTANERKGNYGT